ncbi:MAG: GNAT family N-acetyltransferase [Paracoccaceae bacterium]
MSTPNPELVIRRATVDDMPQVLEFVGETYGPGAPFKDVARHRWQFENSPFRPEDETAPSIWLAFDGARVVGEIAVQDGRIWLDGSPVSAGWIVDVMVHPDFRGMGLSHRIHDAIMAERAVLVTLTMAPATRRVAERVGCMTLGPTRQYVLPHRLSAQTVARFLEYKAGIGGPMRRKALRAFNASRLGPMLVSGAGRLLTRALRLRGAFRSSNGFSHVEIGRFPDEIDEFWARARRSFPAIFERSARFLNWRFVDCPGLTYRRFLLHKDGMLKGYLITRVGDAAELPMGVLVDAFADPDEQDALDALVALAVNTLSPDAEYVEAAASTPAWQAALRRAGFVATKTMRPTVVCTDPALRARLVRHADDWHFTKADHDWDQIHPM